MPTQSTETLIEEALKDFDGVFPCIQSGCGNDGVIPEQDGEGDWQPAQCEFCYKIRFPVKEYFIKELKTIATKSAEKKTNKKFWIQKRDGSVDIELKDGKYRLESTDITISNGVITHIDNGLWSDLQKESNAKE